MEARLPYDVCNGDADGLCAVLQWRLHRPAESRLVTGLKREIALLQRVPPERASEVLVCDVSMRRNRAALLALLAAGVRVTYFDHHMPGEMPSHPLLDAHIDVASDVCTSLLVDRHLGSRFAAWAVVGAYGDDQVGAAERLAAAAGFDAARRALLQRLGRAINYNAYGDGADDVLIEPAELYRRMSRCPDPASFVAADPIAAQLDERRESDLRLALGVAPARESEHARLVVLPDADWCRRVSGALANELATAHPAQAQAVLRPGSAGAYVVSVRAPRSRPGGADRLCDAFGGSGRAGAAGIDALPEAELQRFADAFERADWGSTPGP